LKKILSIAFAAAAVATPLLATAPAYAQSVCVHVQVTVNGTTQTVDQCLP
jgi:hypothetical protein